MRRISTATKVVDKFGTGKHGFTNGNPVGGVAATDLEDVWFDHVQEEIASPIEAAGLTLDVNDRAQLLAAIQILSAPVVGLARNVKMAVTAASASATLTADQVVVAAALGGRHYRLPSFNKTINLATTGAGGMDTGSAPNSGYVALYAIYNPTTGTSALLAKNATSAVQPEVYGGANMPSGYTASALVSVWPTNASGQFKVGAQADRRIAFPRIQVLATNTTQASPTLMSVSSAVPMNAKAMGGTIQVGSSTTAGANGASLTSDSAGADYAEVGITGNVVTGNWRLGLQTAQAIYYALQGTTGIGLSVYATTYEF